MVVAYGSIRISSFLTLQARPLARRHFLDNYLHFAVGENQGRAAHLDMTTSKWHLNFPWRAEGDLSVEPFGDGGGASAPFVCG